MSLIFQWIQQRLSIYTTATDLPRPVIATDSSGNSYVAYVAINSIQNDDPMTVMIDIGVVKLDSLGNVIWYRQQPSFETTENDLDPTICVDSEGNIYVAYVSGGSSSVVNTTTNATNATTNIVVFKLNSNGDTIWAKQSPDFNTQLDNLAPSIATDSSGYVYVAYCASNPTISTLYHDSIVLFKLDTNGELIWLSNSVNFNTSGGNYNPSLGVDQLGHCYVAYFNDGISVSSQTSVGGRDIIVFKTDTDGKMLWVRQQPSFDTTSDDLYPSLAVSKNDSLCVAYLTMGTASGQTSTSGIDIVVFKMNTDGDTIWVKQNSTFNTTFNNAYASVGIDSMDNIYVTYSTQGQLSGQMMTGSIDVVVFVMDRNGTTLQTLQRSSFNTIHQNVHPSLSVDEQGNCLVVYYSIDPDFLSDHTSNRETGWSENLPTQELIIFKLRNQSCVSGDTLIRLADGTEQEIRVLQRGDVVAPHHRIARVCQEPIDPSSIVDLMVFEPHCLGPQQPDHRLVITPNHPIFYRGSRRPARCFEQCNGVSRLRHVKVEDVIDLLGGQPCWYDLQFDHEGSFSANGLELQSRSPYSYWGPLLKEYYYDQSLYSDDRVWDTSDQAIPLDETPIHLNHVILQNKRHHRVINERSLGDMTVITYR